MLGQNFPIDDYYKSHIVDAITLSRKGVWWTAVLLIEDPKTDHLFVSIYRWQKTGDDWKKRSSMRINSKKDCSALEEALSGFQDRLG